MTIGEFVERHSVCDGGSEAAKGESHRDVKEAWDNVDKASWLFWMISRARVDQKKLVKAACACAREVLPFVPAGEKRPLAAIEAAEGWADGKVEKAAVIQAAKDALACSQELTGGTPAHIAAFVASEAANSVKTALRTPSVAMAVGETFAAAEQGTAESKDKALSAILRRFVTWADVDAAIQSFKPQPKEDYELRLSSGPSDEKVQADVEKQVKQVESLLGQAEEIKQRYQSILKDNGLDSAFMSKVKNSPALGSAGTAVVAIAASAMDEEESAPKTSAPRRARTMI